MPSTDSVGVARLVSVLLTARSDSSALHKVTKGPCDPAAHDTLGHPRTSPPVLSCLVPSDGDSPSAFEPSFRRHSAGVLVGFGKPHRNPCPIMGPIGLIMGADFVQALSSQLQNVLTMTEVVDCRLPDALPQALGVTSFPVSWLAALVWHTSPPAATNGSMLTRPLDPARRLCC